MGYTGIFKSIPETKEIILRDMNFVGATIKSEVLKSATYGNEFWILRRITELPTEKTYITATVVIMSHKNGETTYKEIDVDCHPYYYKCPSSWLGMIEPQGILCREWLEKAKRIQEISKMEIVPGMKIDFHGTGYTTVQKVSSHFWQVRREDGKNFKMKTVDIREHLA